MALVATAIGIYDQSATTTITLSRSDVFDGATPKAAIVTAITGSPSTYNTQLAPLRYSIGAVAGSRALGCGVVSFNNSSPSNARRIASDSNPIIIPGGSSSTQFGMKMSGALVANGVTLTKTGTWASTQDLSIQVILLGGDDFDAYLPSGFVSSTTVNKSIPFLPNAAMVFGCDIPDDGNSYGSGIISQGFIVDKDDGLEEGMARQLDIFDNSGTATKSNINTNEFYGNLGGSLSNRMTHVSFAEDDLGNIPVTYEHNYTTSNNSSTPHYCPLYMKFDNEDVSLGEITLPTTTGLFTKNNYGFDPAVISIMGNTGVTAYNTIANNANSGNSWDWRVEGSANTTEFVNKQSSSPSDTWSKSVLGAFAGINFGSGATSFEGVTAQRITGGFSVDFTEVTGSAGYTIGIAMGTPAEGGLNIALGGDTAEKAYLGSTEVSTAYLGSDSVGGVGGWRTIYSDPNPASSASDWTGRNTTVTAEVDGLRILQTAAGFASGVLEITTVVGKDYRITWNMASVTQATVQAIASDSAASGGTPLTNGMFVTQNGGPYTLTFKAISTLSEFQLVSVFDAFYETLADITVEEMV